MKTKMEKTVHAKVAKIAKMGGSRDEVCRDASVSLNEKHGINCASDGSKAGEYLIEALDENCGHNHE